MHKTVTHIPWRGSKIFTGQGQIFGSVSERKLDVGVRNIQTSSRSKLEHKVKKKKKKLAHQFSVSKGHDIYCHLSENLKIASDETGFLSIT